VLVVLGGCGDSGGGSSTSIPSTSIPSCDAAQIEPTHRKEGTCRRNKQVIVVVNPQSTLKLADVTVRLTRPPTLDNQTYKRTGTLVFTIPMQVHNGTDRPQRFPATYRRGRTGQLVLQLGSHLYIESLRLERTYARGVTPRPFVLQPPIPAGATRDGSVVVAFPRGLTTKPGQTLLLVTTFADAGKAKTPARLGIIRLYR
jgi:hypothetical protein